MAEGVLQAILERKRRDVAERLAGSTFDAAPTRRSLAAALSRPGARFIMEVKKASPSGHRSALSVDKAVDAFAPVADAISVLTDTPFFEGSLDDLGIARARFDGPILAKDFIVDARQVAEARARGADAVLAIMAALTDSEAAAVLVEADRLSMDVLVEVHDEGELQRALRFGARIIGVNNRDLGTLRTDLATTERLAAMVPGDRILVSESGLSNRSDVARLAPFADAFLVGSSLMESTEIVEAARALVHGRVKVCGLTNADDVWTAGLAGATHAGFVFAPGTPRAIAPRPARPLAEQARAAGMKTVGVFRDSPAKAVLEVADSVGLDVVQLHGRENADTIARIAGRFSGEVWTAGSPEEDRGGDRPLFDGGPGGSGRRIDWRRVAAHGRRASAVLAGGIGPHNARAAQAIGTYGIDICSGLESSPGQKDPVRVQALFDALRPACRRSVQCG